MKASTCGALADRGRYRLAEVVQHRLDFPPGAGGAIGAGRHKKRRGLAIAATDDGRMVLWDTGMVKPVSCFETSRMGEPYIDSGHYVIDWKGHAITVPCGN